MLQTLRGKRTLREGQHSYLPSFYIRASHPTNYLTLGRKASSKKRRGEG
jgi:hypothetical protein